MKRTIVIDATTRDSEIRLTACFMTKNLTASEVEQSLHALTDSLVEAINHRNGYVGPFSFREIKIKK